jgi:adenosylcobyric acid synthase
LEGAGGGSTFKDQQYDKLAAHVRQHVDMDKLYQILTSND